MLVLKKLKYLIFFLYALNIILNFLLIDILEKIIFEKYLRQLNFSKMEFHHLQFLIFKLLYLLIIILNVL